jgi:hypothetical protein
MAGLTARVMAVSIAKEVYIGKVKVGISPA